MITCTSCKNNTSTDRCSRKPLKGLLFCGTHAKVKNPRLWTAINKIDDKVILIQKVWRGYSLRNWIRLAGPGALSRSVCHNEEELVTFDDKKSVSPLDYFAFEEAGKVYWFDIRSILQNSIDKIRPINPYTREPLSIDTRQRLRKLAVLRDVRKLKNLHDENRGTAEDVLRVTWTSVCQIIEENGFPDMSPMFFTSLNRTQLNIFAQLIHADMIAWASEHTSSDSRRKKYVSWIRRVIKEHQWGANTSLLSYLTARFLLTMLNDYPEPYGLCFIIMSALHRV